MSKQNGIVNHTSDAYPAVAPGTGFVYELTGELLCTASQKAIRRSRFPSSTAWIDKSNNELFILLGLEAIRDYANYYLRKLKPLNSQLR